MTKIIDKNRPFWFSDSVIFTFLSIIIGLLLIETILVFNLLNSTAQNNIKMHTTLDVIEQEIMTVNSNIEQAVFNVLDDIVLEEVQ